MPWRPYNNYLTKTDTGTDINDKAKVYFKDIRRRYEYHRVSSRIAGSMTRRLFIDLLL